MNNYELTMILNSAIEEEGITSFLDKVETILAKGEGKVAGVDKWGLRKLAYPIQDQGEGYYILLRLRATPDLVAELDKNLKLSNDVLRFMLIATEEKKVSKEEGGN